MQLYGSTTSPYVRRIRMWLKDQDFEFINLDIFSAEGHATLLAKNPTMKIPMLCDGDTTIYDSRIIQRYLNQKLALEQLSWEDENTLTLIDGANDSLVELLLLSRSGIAMDSELMFVQRQQQRVSNIMTTLEQKAQQGAFEQWGYVAICLYCLLDWVAFRNLHDMTEYPALNQFRQQHLTRPEAQSSDPRN